MPGHEMNRLIHKCWLFQIINLHTHASNLRAHLAIEKCNCAETSPQPQHSPQRTTQLDTSNEHMRWTYFLPHNQHATRHGLINQHHGKKKETRKEKRRQREEKRRRWNTRKEEETKKERERQREPAIMQNCNQKRINTLRRLTLATTGVLRTDNGTTRTNHRKLATPRA